MSRVHFLNVNDGDCSIIQHYSDRVTVIDISAAEKIPQASSTWMSLAEGVMNQYSKGAGVYGNFNRSEYPDNPIMYMLERGISSVFRFISTHPDMDHLDGIKHFFEVFQPQNFWDTDNTKEMDEGFDEGRYSREDWDFYRALRAGDAKYGVRRLALYAGIQGAFYNQAETGGGGGDGLHILAPTPELVAAGNSAEDWNDSSYVILYRTGNKRILFSGDSHDATWEYILRRFRKDVANVDVLIAPHHGRHSGRSYDFLNIVRPKLTLFGNGPSEHMAYPAWNSRDLLSVSNNQGGTIILDIMGNTLDAYVSHKPFAEAFVERRPYATNYNSNVRGWFIGRWN